MKICLYLQRNFAPLGDAIAAVLRDEYGVDEFCAYVGLRPALRYLKERGRVSYSLLVLDEDVHRRYEKEQLDVAFLRAFEEEYGMPNLWRFLYADRTLLSGIPRREYPHDAPLYDHEDLLRIVQVTAKAILDLFEREKPDALIMPLVGSLGSFLLYRIAQKQGIPVRLFYPALFESRYVISSCFDHFSLKKEQGDAFRVSPSEGSVRTARAFLESFRARPVPYAEELTPDRQPVTRGRQWKFLLPRNLARAIGGVWHEFSSYYGNDARRDYSTVPPWNFVLDRAARKLRNLRGADDLWEKPREGEPFAYFPLQVEPEISLLVQAPTMTDQLYAVRQAARALPVGWKLYVKEHPQMVEYRTRAYWKAIKKIPNVRLIDPRLKSFGLIRESGLVIAITDTGAFEACLLGKPVVTLGKHFINDLSFVNHCERMEDLPQMVREQTHTFRYDNHELVHYLAKIVEASAVVDVPRLWVHERDADAIASGVRPLADLFARSLGLMTQPRSYI